MISIGQIIQNILLVLAAITASKYTLYLITSLFYMYSRSKYLRKAMSVSKRDIEEMFKISVIVPAWNEAVGILDCVHSLYKASYSNLEIVVVNDGSKDNTDTVIKDFIKQELPKLKSTKTFKYVSKSNGGKGSALNAGIKKSSGDLIVTMDADTIFEEDALYNAAMYFYKTDLDAAVGNVKIANSKSLLGIIQQIEYTVGFYFKRSHSVLNSEYIIGGAFGVFRRNVFKKYG